MSNPYVNKVQFGNTTIMDITDTTATSDEVLDGEVFYAASGTRSVGTLGDATQSSHGLMSSTDKTKLDNISVMQGATANDNGVQGLVPSPTSDDRYKFLAGDGTYRSGGLPMVILSYGHSTWNDFIEAYNNNVIVYCRASSQTNPANGDQTRMAFMAYVNATPPTYVEFQYYRSVGSHTNAQMSDQVYIYGLREDIGWTVTVRQTGVKKISGANGFHTIYSGIEASYNDNVVALRGGLPAVNFNDNGKILKVANGAWALVDAQETADEALAKAASIPNAGSVSATGAISFKHDETELFTVQLPIYDGGVTDG